jgi:sugar phosphate isomerase/epimerase
MEILMNHITRRTVLRNGAATAASVALMTALSKHLQAKSFAKSPGIQLYTVGKELTEDMPGTLAKIAAMGYRTVESAGMGGKSAAEFRKALDAAGLKCPSSHMFPMPGQSTAQVFDDAKTLGSEYVVASVQLKTEGLKSVEDYIRVLSALTEDDYKRMVGTLNDLATQAKSAGLKFAYHNHNMEFHKWADGQTTYEILMAGTDSSLVKIELDCGWSDLGGCPPLEVFKKYPGRVKMLHIKDFAAVGHPLTELNAKEMPEPTELGKGHIDYKPILAAAPAAGVEHIFVEQEPPFVHFTVWEAAKADYDYLQSIT